MRRGPSTASPAPLEGVWDGILEHHISPTTLEAYGRCPFQYFARRVLRLERLERPEEAAPVQALEWGRICHEILQRFYQDAARAWGDDWSAWLDSAAALRSLPPLRNVVPRATRRHGKWPGESLSTRCERWFGRTWTR